MFKIKRKADGSIEKYKARLVAKCFKQKFGIDYTETFTPVVKYVTLCMVIVVAKFFDWPIDQLDDVTAFLYVEMKEVVYIDVPEDMNAESGTDSIELLKSIYGLKQASRVWNDTLTSLWSRSVLSHPSSTYVSTSRPSAIDAFCF